jgi:TfoX/Sxy family transcriptional regulator of competence genes
LKQLFDSVLPADPRVERRSMFGCPCAFAGGNMFIGLHQENMIVRLGEADRAALLARPGAEIFEPMEGRPMREYVALPLDMLEQAEEVEPWVRRALEYAASLPPKGAKGGARKRAAPAKKAAAPAKKGAGPAKKGTGPAKKAAAAAAKKAAAAPAKKAAAKKRG